MATQRTRLDGRDIGARNRDGRFTTGNPGGPGRPRRTTERGYLAAIADACPPAAWGEIVARAVADARAGDATARAWLASYLVGRPESAAVTLHTLAVEHEAGTDAVDADAMLARMLGV